jgi:serine/threonine-protein phosphatase 6 regulatory ankyrin repeat subunit A
MFDVEWTPLKEKEFNRALESGVGLDVPDCHGYYPIHWAVERDRLDIVNWLGRQGVSLNSCTPEGFPPMVFAIIRTNARMVHWLLSHGAQIHKYSLHLAIKRFDIQMISLLLRYGANIDSQDPDGNTVLHLAVYYKLVDLVPFLLDSGANREIKNNWGYTPEQLLYR